LVLLHVVEPLIGTYVSGEAVVYSSIEDQDALRVEQAAVRLRELAGAEGSGNHHASLAVVRGDPAAEIVKFAQAQQFDLIVMPTHGHGPFRRLLLGSVTAKVLHDAACPVWTGPHLAEAPVPESIHFRRVVCALDLGAESAFVLGWAARFAREYAAHLAIVHVLPAATAQLGGFYFDPEWAVQMAETARIRIGAIQEEVSTRAEVSVEVGDTPDGVSRAAARLGADLLVIGSGRRAGVLGRLRATAYAILRESPCPVAAV
jgi:nucleotide-binding universal stress UspA family protein